MSGNRFSQRRQILSKVAAAVGAIGASPMAALARNKNQVTGASSKFTGEYEDSNHPGCLRSIKVVAPRMEPTGYRGPYPLAIIKGVDGLPAGSSSCPDGVKPTIEELWTIEGEVTTDDDDDVETLRVDFTPKGGPKGVIAKFDETGGKPGILFPDGNKWMKIKDGTPDRRPKVRKMNDQDEGASLVS
jgi:hypothetical protein